MLAVLKRYLPHILVAVALISVISAAYASVVMSASSQLHVTWNPNPVTITVSPTTGTGSATVQLTCNQPANDLVLTPKGGDNSGVKLTITPSQIPFCSSTPVTITLTATCQPQAGNSGSNKPDQNKCTGSEGEVNMEVDVTRPYNYYGNQQIPDKLRVKVIIEPSKPDFQLTSNPAAITCNVGQTVTTTITVTPTNGFTGTTKLSTTVLPTGITADIALNNVLGSGTRVLTINCSTPGQFSVEVRGVISYASHGITIPVTVAGTSLPSFTITGEESSLTCLAGGTAHDDITASAKNGFTGPITLSSDVTPTGVTATNDPTSLAGSGSATLTIQCTTAGMYNVKVKGVSGEISSTFILTLTVTSPSTGDFMITADATSVTSAPDVKGTSSITVTGTGMFTGPVTLTLSAPSNLNCQLGISSLPVATAGGDASTSLKCNSHVAGTYTATVTGTAAGKTHNVDVKFTVQEVSLAANNPTMFGFDPMLFYGIVGAIVVAGAGSGALLLRRRSLPRTN